jgi:hypothetical protein
MHDSNMPGKCGKGEDARNGSVNERIFVVDSRCTDQDEFENVSDDQKWMLRIDNTALYAPIGSNPSIRR